VARVKRAKLVAQNLDTFHMHVKAYLVFSFERNCSVRKKKKERRGLFSFERNCSVRKKKRKEEE
jgi:hypothetical protein